MVGTVTSVANNTDDWIRLSEVWQWIDKRYGAYKRLSAGWVQPDAILVQALSTGKVRARGLGPSLERGLVPLDNSQPAPTVRAELTIIDTLAASGLLTNENDNSECAAAIKKLERLHHRAGLHRTDQLDPLPQIS